MVHCSYLRQSNKSHLHSTQSLALWPWFALEEDSWVRMKWSNYGVYKFLNVKTKSLTQTGLFMNGQRYSDWVKNHLSCKGLEFYFERVYSLQTDNRGNVILDDETSQLLLPGPYKQQIFTPHYGLTSEAPEWELRMFFYVRQEQMNHGWPRATQMSRTIVKCLWKCNRPLIAKAHLSKRTRWVTCCSRFQGLL